MHTQFAHAIRNQTKSTWSRLAQPLVTLLFILGAIVLMTPRASAASLVEVTNFGTNPSGLRMFVYVPNNAGTNPAILVAVHYCTGSGPAFFSGTEFASLADQFGFIVIYPSATRSGSCFDVSSPQALRHNGGSDPVGIVSMVQYAINNLHGDSSRVYVTGASSGGMMTNVLIGDYPDVFKAGAAFMGVPFACFATTDGSMWNSTCANGNSIKTPQQWGDLVRGAFSGYTGARPRMQLWHGTADTTLFYPNFGEEIKQWTNVLNVSQTPTLTDHPQSSWTHTRYGGTGVNAPVEAFSIQGAGHVLPINGQGMALRAIQFFGLDGSGGGNPPPPPPPPPPSGGCSVSYTVNAWNTGLTANIHIVNTSNSTINGWSLVFTLPSGQTITSGWGATYSPSSGLITARNVSYNGQLSPSGSADAGLQANHNGNTSKPTSFTLNGVACTVN